MSRRFSPTFPIFAFVALLATAPSAFVHASDGAHDHAAEDGQVFATCHVCRLHDGETEAELVVATFEFDGATYGFCSEGCRDRFAEDPVTYVPQALPRPAPAFTVVDLAGESFSSEALAGQWTLLDFWATWCPPCVADLPKLSAMHDRYADRGFAVVGISIDEGRRVDRKVARMMKRRGASHPVYLDVEEEPAWEAYRVASVPAQFLVNPDGQIVAEWSGKIDLAAVEAEVRRALGLKE